MTKLSDIAKLSGVSTATVSRIINGKGEASPETIQRVMDLVKELNYQPNRLAKSLSQRSSNTIAVLIPNLLNPFFGELVTAIDLEATQQGIQILICNTNDRREKVEQAIESIINQYAFGAVISSMQVTTQDLKRLENAGVHTITVDRASFDHPYSAISIDQENGFYKATRFLIEKGCKKIVMISATADLELTPNRENGYAQALKRNKAHDPIILRGDFSMQSGYAVITEYLRDNKLDGILASNDLMAIGAMRACAEYGLSIPHDVKIIGNDNLNIDEYLHPPLTSLSQQSAEISRAIIDELISLKSKESLPKKSVFQPELIVRETT